MNVGNTFAVIALISLNSARNTARIHFIIAAEGQDFSIGCPILESTKSVWWVKDEMTVLSISGEDPSFSAVVLWPESREKYKFRLEEFSTKMTVVNVSFHDAADYRCVLDLHQPGRFYTVAVVGRLTCRWDDDDNDDNNNINDDGNLSKSQSSRVKRDWNMMRCSVETSDNFDDEATNLTFHLFEIRKEDNASVVDTLRDVGELTASISGKSRLPPLTLTPTPTPRERQPPIAVRVGHRSESYPRVVGVAFRWRPSVGNHGTRRWVVRVEATQVRSGPVRLFHREMVRPPLSLLREEAGEEDRSKGEDVLSSTNASLPNRDSSLVSPPSMFFASENPGDGARTFEEEEVGFIVSEQKDDLDGVTIPEVATEVFGANDNVDGGGGGGGGRKSGEEAGERDGGADANESFTAVIEDWMKGVANWALWPGICVFVLVVGSLLVMTIYFCLSRKRRRISPAPKRYAATDSATTMANKSLPDFWL